MKHKVLYYCIALLCSTTVSAQLFSYDQKIPLQGVSDTWHSIELPHSIFQNIKTDFSDIRVYGITEKDTLEAPYILRSSASTGKTTEIDFKIINRTSSGQGHYITFEVPVSKSINQIRPYFKNTNFDWKVTLEGSQNQERWFTLLEDYRILSIKNSTTDYSFTNLNFPSAKYRYYRLLIKSDVTPELLRSSLALDSLVPATYQNYTSIQFDITESETSKKTIIDINLKQRLPVSFLQFQISDAVDYYRPISITYVADSVETEKGWRYSYRNLYSGTLTSLEKDGFTFESTLAQKFRVTVNNNDNRSLAFSSVLAKGYRYHLVSRFTEEADYYLVYGNPNVHKPKYDIQQVGFELPKNPKLLQLGEAEIIKKIIKPQTAPLFENELWLWATMGVVILVLGGFTIKMMQKKV